jgi:hypothetical protein
MDLAAAEVKNFEDFQENIEGNMYRIGEYFVNEIGEIFQVPENLNKDNFDEYLKECSFEGVLIYAINWEDQHLYAENSKKIPPVYGDD